MLVILRSLKASQDLDEIWDYLTDNLGIARSDAFLDHLAERISVLADFPNMGYKCDELAPGLRALRLDDYLVFYRRRENTVEIARVLHSARDIKNLFNNDG